MSDYLSKPFNLEQLEEILLRWVPKKKVTTDHRDSASVKELLNIDEKLLQQLRNLRPGLLLSVVNLFRQSTPEILITLEQNIINQQADAMFKTAHSLKNSAANLGIRSLAEVCKELESNGRQGDLTHAQEYLDQINKLYLLSLTYWDELEGNL
jgi:HPt (histidine-containing phosphotransfer) domain-containing protein